MVLFLSLPRCLSLSLSSHTLYSLPKGFFMLSLLLWCHSLFYPPSVFSKQLDVWWIYHYMTFFFLLEISILNNKFEKRTLHHTHMARSKRIFQGHELLKCKKYEKQTEKIFPAFFFSRTHLKD